MDLINCRGGVNLRQPAWHPDLETKNQCVWMKNMRHANDYAETIPGTVKYQSTSLGSGKITALMPYYNDQTDEFKLLCAFEDKIYKRDPSTNEWTQLKAGLTPNSIYSSVIRNDVMYIASENDGLMKYLGGNQIEDVGGGATEPGNFRQVVYMKEIDRLFGISDDAILGQISWCDLSDPETWDAANVNRMKLQDGERTEGAETLFGKLIIMNTYSLWIYYVSGNEENWRLEQAPTTVGCYAPNTIKRVGSEIWFLGGSPKQGIGIYSFNGSTCKLLTDDISPFLSRANMNKIRNACAELHGDLYSFSYAMDASETNDTMFDLDIKGVVEGGSPAIYGPHDRGFISTCVLNNRQNDEEFLMGDESDGFVYKEGGVTKKSVNLTDGGLLSQRFISRTHHDGSFDTMKRYDSLRIYFRPRTYFQSHVIVNLSRSTYGVDDYWSPDAQDVAHAGEFSIYDKILYGIPELYEYIHDLPYDARGTSIQIELRNDVLGQRMEFDGYKYDSSELYQTKKVDFYAS